MATPTTRATFKEFCLRKLGKGVIDINVTDEQVDDRVDEALNYFYDYHFDGSDRIFYQHQTVADDFTNKYVTMPQWCVGVSDILPITSSTSASSLFNIRYQLHLSDLFFTSATNTLSYYMVMTHIAHLEELFEGKTPFRYNRHVNKLYIDMDWNSKLSVGQYIVVDCYKKTDPDDNPDVWDERWLQEYTTQLIKQQWGSNLTKFEDLQLPGGVRFNGQKIYDDATEQVTKLRDEVIMDFSLPVNDMVG